MTEKRIIKNLTEIINSMIKKTNAYEKTESILKKLSIFMVFTGTIFIINYFTLYNISFLNTQKLEYIKNIHNEIEELKSNINHLHEKIDNIIKDNKATNEDTTKINTELQNQNNISDDFVNLD